jgi:hypothetical protein
MTPKISSINGSRLHQRNLMLIRKKNSCNSIMALKLFNLLSPPFVQTGWRLARDSHLLGFALQYKLQSKPQQTSFYVRFHLDASGAEPYHDHVLEPSRASLPPSWTWGKRHATSCISRRYFSRHSRTCSHHGLSSWECSVRWTSHKYICRRRLGYNANLTYRPTLITL